MKVQFANGLIYEAKTVDEAISKCLSSGNDPFNPIVIAETIKQEIKEKVEEENGNQEQY